jgi:dephospho-CoA kinase
MFKVGLTGGIGSGKSTVAAIFEVLGIPVYYADAAAKRMMQEDPGLKQRIIQAFGQEAYREGRLDRAWLSAHVFSDPENIKRINAIVHPATIRDAHDWMDRQNTPYVLKEAALVFESGSEKELDFVIGVSAPEEIRIRRAMQRDGVSRQQVLGRMQHQMEESGKMGRCDHVIVNDEKAMVIPQVLELHGRLLRLAKGRAGDD